MTTFRNSTQPHSVWQEFSYDSLARQFSVLLKDGRRLDSQITPSTFQRLLESRNKLSFMRREIGLDMPVSEWAGLHQVKRKGNDLLDSP